MKNVDEESGRSQKFRPIELLVTVEIVLIELLALIAIAAVLIAAMLPASRAASIHAKSTASARATSGGEIAVVPDSTTEDTGPQRTRPRDGDRSSHAVSDRILNDPNPRSRAAKGKTFSEGHRRRDGSSCGCSACAQTVAMFKTFGIVYGGSLLMIAAAFLISKCSIQPQMPSDRR